MIWEPQVHGRLYPDRPYFLTRVRQGMAMLPPELQATLRDAGYNFNIGSNFKTLHKKNSKSYGEYSKFHSLFGHAFFQPASKSIFYPQGNRLVNLFEKASGWVNYDAPIRIAIHEIAHAFDDYIIPETQGSQSFSFLVFTHNDSLKKPPLKDLGKLTSNSALLDFTGFNSYFRSELFAEIFTDIILDKDRIRQHFPNLTQYIKNQIQDVCDVYNAFNPESNPQILSKMEMTTA